MMADHWLLVLLGNNFLSHYDAPPSPSSTGTMATGMIGVGIMVCSAHHSGVSSFFFYCMSRTLLLFCLLTRRVFTTWAVSQISGAIFVWLSILSCFFTSAFHSQYTPLSPFPQVRLADKWAKIASDAGSAMIALSPVIDVGCQRMGFMELILAQPEYYWKAKIGGCGGEETVGLTWAF